MSVLPTLRTKTTRVQRAVIMFMTTFHRIYTTRKCQFSISDSSYLNSSEIWKPDFMWGRGFTAGMGRTLSQDFSRY